MDIVTVLVPQAKLADVGRLPARHALVDLERAWLVVGVQQAFPGADVRLDLVLAMAEHLLPSRRVDDGACFQIPVPDALLCTREGQSEPLLAFPQRQAGARPVGDVAHNDL